MSMRNSDGRRKRRGGILQAEKWGKIGQCRGPKLHIEKNDTPKTAKAIDLLAFREGPMPQKIGKIEYVLEAGKRRQWREHFRAWKRAVRNGQFSPTRRAGESPLKAPCHKGINQPVFNAEIETENTGNTGGFVCKSVCNRFVSLAEISATY